MNEKTFREWLEEWESADKATCEGDVDNKTVDCFKRYRADVAIEPSKENGNERTSG